MRSIRAVLFDLDHTLYDRDASFRRWAAVFVRERLGLDDGPAATAAIERLADMDACGYRPREELFALIRQHYPWLAVTTKDMIATFYDEHLACLALDPGVADLLDALDAASLPFGIVTNGSAQQQRKVERLGLDGRAGCVLISAVVGCRKPEPAIFLAAASALGVAPGDILFAGDNPEADIAGAAGVGMRTAWLRRGQSWPTRLAITPDHSIDTLAELGWVAVRHTVVDPVVDARGA